jgi:hypothetical protein
MVIDGALDFVLPGFSRHTWTSGTARDEWEPRMDRIRPALQDLIVESVNRGRRPCGVVRARHSELDALARRCAGRGMAVAPIEPAPSPKSTAAVTANYALETLVCGPMPTGTATAVVGRSADLEALAALWGGGACAEVATLLGYPSCCREFLAGLVDEHRLDATWSVAHNSDTSTNDRSYVAIRAQHETNLLWAPMSITLLPHIPCQFGCAASLEVGRELVDLARVIGYDAEIGWVQQILSWPVQWSALHGIGETKTPILKMATRTDATAAKHTLDWQGAGGPESGTPGLSFPHRPPRRLKISDSRSFARGLANTDGGESH